MTRRPHFVLGSLALALTACAVGPDHRPPDIPAAERWSAPLPPTAAHGGDPAALRRWWASWHDPALSALIDAAQTANPSVAVAAARIAEARALVDAQTGALLPTLTGRASDTRSKGGAQGSANPFAPPDTVQHTRTSAIDAAWELDLVGGARRAREAARARVDARVAEWHEARVSIAAEVALQYVSLRTCELFVIGMRQDAESRAETARLVDLRVQAGLDSASQAALIRAGAQESTARLAQQRADCAILVAALAELTGMTADRIRAMLADKPGQVPLPAEFTVSAIPAASLGQRPDLAAAEAELHAATADVGVTMADRFPRLTLSGSIAVSDFIAPAGTGLPARSWSIGPALNLPLFDFGRRAANVDAARARFETAAAQYRAKALRAVREVEEALQRLDSATRRETYAQGALENYRRALAATEAREAAGTTSRLEREEAHRAVVAAQGAALGVQRERLAAWIALYKAVGGGFSTDTGHAPTSL